MQKRENKTEAEKSVILCLVDSATATRERWWVNENIMQDKESLQCNNIIVVGSIT